MEYRDYKSETEELSWTLHDNFLYILYCCVQGVKENVGSFLSNLHIVFFFSL